MNESLNRSKKDSSRWIDLLASSSHVSRVQRLSLRAAHEKPAKRYESGSTMVVECWFGPVTIKPRK